MQEIFAIATGNIPFFPLLLANITSSLEQFFDSYDNN